MIRSILFLASLTAFAACEQSPQPAQAAQDFAASDVPVRNTKALDLVADTNSPLDMLVPDPKIDTLRVGAPVAMRALVRYTTGSVELSHRAEAIAPTVWRAGTLLPVMLFANPT
jgi:PBP1b-binding outer membrane lipoprotein LpoB